jgi:hypothetical protein
MPYHTNLAQDCAEWLAGNVPNPLTRRVCDAGLQSVGLLSWSPTMPAFTELLPGNALNTKQLGTVCFAAPVAFALMGFVLSLTECNKFYAIKTTASANKQDVTPPLLHWLYGRVAHAIRRWKDGDGDIPAGAMVFHGSTDAPCAHVTLSVGRGYVVSCWGAGLAMAGIDGGAGLTSEAGKLFKQEVDVLLKKNLSPDTLVLRQESFSDFKNPVTRLHHTKVPFWELW